MADRSIVPDAHTTIRIVAALATAVAALWMVVSTIEHASVHRAAVEAAECPVALRTCQTALSTASSHCKQANACIAVGCRPPPPHGFAQ